MGAAAFVAALALSLEDGHESCAAWAESGECENNPEFMHAHCAYSCKNVQRDTSQMASQAPAAPPPPCLPAAAPPQAAVHKICAHGGVGVGRLDAASGAASFLSNCASHALSELAASALPAETLLASSTSFEVARLMKSSGSACSKRPVRHSTRGLASCRPLLLRGGMA